MWKTEKRGGIYWAVVKGSQVVYDNKGKLTELQATEIAKTLNQLEVCQLNTTASTEV